MNEANDETGTHLPTEQHQRPKLRLLVAKVLVTYEEVELPERCPDCGAPFLDSDGARPLREVNLADTSFCGSMVCTNLFEPDLAMRCEEPETFWYPYRYECIACDRLIAGGDVAIIDAPEEDEDAPGGRRSRALPEGAR